MTSVPRIVVTDYTFPDLGPESARVQQSGFQLVGHHCKTQDELISAVAGADAVISQFARTTPAVIAAMDRARAIVRYGIGVDNVDLDAARAHAIPVSNITDYCIEEVADHTPSFILGLTRQVVTHTRAVQAGRWGVAVPVQEMRVLREQTVGVLGFGRIGREVVRRLLAFKCRVLVHDPVSAAADILTLHCPSTPATRKLIGPALLVNLSRGDLVDTDALVVALPAEHPLPTLPQVIVAPHIASVSPTARRVAPQCGPWHHSRAQRGLKRAVSCGGAARSPVPNNEDPNEEQAAASHPRHRGQ